MSYLDALFGLSEKLTVITGGGGVLAGAMTEVLLVDENTGDLTERGRTVIKRTPFGRFGEVKELAGAVLFLARSKTSGFVIGITIPIDGGFLVDNI
jgi:NAD(P)-dependent dehydrogenase (short-subunit alcohol dehydrogenase family)